jgi:signal transduction histidine kinase
MPDGQPSPIIAAMAQSDSLDRLIPLAGYLAWGASGLPVILNAAREPARLQHPGFWGWAAVWLLFIVLSRVTGRLEKPCRRAVALTLLALLTAAALAAFSLSPTPYGAILLVITAAQAAALLPWAAALAWITAQTLGFGLIIQAIGATRSDAALVAFAYLTFELFAVIVIQSAAREKLAREELGRVNAELTATQALLIDAGQSAERVRISRELHDLLGHHLTALNLNLELAAHVTEGQAQAAVEKSRQLAKLLLSDVRAAVSELRAEDTFDLARAVRTLVVDLPAPQIHLTLPDDLRLEDPARAQALLRCVQELLTNAVKHAGAQNLWIELIRNDKGIALYSRDDGRGSAQPEGGNGLRGMRERLKAVGGHLDITTAPGAGFKLDFFLPFEGMAANGEARS